MTQALSGRLQKGFAKLLRLLDPVVAFGPVFEGEEQAEGFDIGFGPVGDLLEGADSVGVELLAEHAFDAFDFREIVLLGDACRLLQAAVQGLALTLQTLQLGLCFGHLGFAVFQAFHGELEFGGIGAFLAQTTGFMLPCILLLLQGVDECLLLGDAGFQMAECGLRVCGVL